MGLTKFSLVPPSATLSSVIINIETAMRGSILRPTMYNGEVSPTFSRLKKKLFNNGVCWSNGSRGD